VRWNVDIYIDNPNPVIWLLTSPQAGTSFRKPGSKCDPAMPELIAAGGWG